MPCGRPSANFSMRPRASLPILLVAAALRLTARADFLEKIHNAFSLNDPENRFHLQLSGVADLGAYSTDHPSPGFIFSDHDFLLNPRLTLFVDLEVGSNIYFFAQTPVDRGLD